MGERPTILLADDEEAITAELQPFLERAGFAVTVARDGEAALAAAMDGAPDLIVLDVLMPGSTAARSCAGCGPPAASPRSSCSRRWEPRASARWRSRRAPTTI